MCLVCILYLLYSLLLLQVRENETGSFSFEEGESVCITGRVRQKACKENKWVFYLEDIQDIKAMGVICYMAESQTDDDAQIPRIGSYVQVKGRYQPFEAASNEGQFDAVSYNQILNRDFSITNSTIVNQTKEYSVICEKLFKLRRRWAEGYEACCSKEEAGFLSSVVLGSQSLMDLEVKELFRRNGLAHILAVSGLHISFVGMLIYKLLKKTGLPAIIQTGVSFSVILLYGIMIDASGSTKRAVCMFGLYLFAKNIGRTYDMATALAIAAILLVREQPLNLRYAGFRLSFGAVLAILVFYPFIKNNFLLPKKFAERKWIVKVWDSFCLSFAISFFMLPLQLYDFYEVPVYASILNLIVIPVFSVVLVCGFTGGILAMLLPPAAKLVLMPCHLVFAFYQKICLVMDCLPGSRWIGGKPDVIRIVIFYMLLFGCMAVVHKRKSAKTVVKQSNRKCLVYIIANLVLLPILLTWQQLKPTEITFLNVGQGDCCVIQDKSGSTFLIDGGSSDVKECGKYRLLPFVKANGISTIDYAFVSHPDEDHMNAVTECLMKQRETGVRIKWLVLSTYAEFDEQYDELKQIAEINGCKVVYFKPGDVIRTRSGLGFVQAYDMEQKEDMEVRCLYPSGQEGFTDTNEQSMALRVQVNGMSVLFTGDMGEEAERQFVKQIQEQVDKGDAGRNTVDSGQTDILKVAHHGSRNSTSEELLEVIQPKLAIISAGKNNRYGHPHKETVERLLNSGAKIFMTSESGAVTLKIYGKRITIEEFYRKEYYDR